MGFRQFYDGSCVVCKHHAEHYCDHCQRFVCKDHIVLKKAPDSTKKFEFCPECSKMKRKPNDAVGDRRNPLYINS